MTRRTLGAAVVLLWVAGLAVFARRQMVHSSRERMIEASLRISPATYYYVVVLNGDTIGAALSSIDTTRNSIVASEMFTGKYPVGKDTLNIVARENSTYSRSLMLRSFMFDLSGGAGPIRIAGRTEGDSLLVVTTTSGSDSSVKSTFRMSSPAFTPTMAPLIGILSTLRNAGDTINVSIFDPITRELKLTSIPVHQDTLFTIVDSAALDRATNEWRAAFTDTIRARKIGGDGAPLTVWVDSDGRIVAASEPGGLKLTRTAFELAFKRANPLSVPPGSRRK